MSLYKLIKEKPYYMVNNIFGDFINENLSFTKDDIFYGTVKQCISLFSHNLKSRFLTNGSKYNFDNKKVNSYLKNNLLYKSNYIHFVWNKSPTFYIGNKTQKSGKDDFIIINHSDTIAENDQYYPFKYFTFLIDVEYLEKILVKPPEHIAFIDPKKIKKESKLLMSNIIYKNIKNKEYYMPTNIGYAEEDLNVTFNIHNLFYGTAKECIGRFIDEIQNDPNYASSHLEDKKQIKKEIKKEISPNEHYAITPGITKDLSKKNNLGIFTIREIYNKSQPLVEGNFFFSGNDMIFFGYPKKREDGTLVSFRYTFLIKEQVLNSHLNFNIVHPPSTKKVKNPPQIILDTSQSIKNKNNEQDDFLNATSAFEQTNLELDKYNNKINEIKKEINKSIKIGEYSISINIVDVESDEMKNKICKFLTEKEYVVSLEDHKDCLSISWWKK